MGRVVTFADLETKETDGVRRAPITRGDVSIPRKLARPRFTTKYYEQFLD